MVGLPFSPEDAYPSSPRLRLLVSKTDFIGERTPAVGLLNDKLDIWDEVGVEADQLEEEGVHGYSMVRHYSKFFEEGPSQPETPLETRGNTFRKDLIKPFAQHPPIVDIERYVPKPATRAGSVSYRSSESSFSKEAERIMFSKGKRVHVEGVTD